MNIIILLQFTILLLFVPIKGKYLILDLRHGLYGLRLSALTENRPENVPAGCRLKRRGVAFLDFR